MNRPIRYSLVISCFLFFWLIPFFSFNPVSAVAQQEQPAVLVIEGGTLIDGNGGAPVADALIIIRGNQIETVSRKGQAQYPAGARVLQADGKFILPGLMDAHVHYQDFLAELFLTHGVTSVFEIGGGGELGLVRREAIARGKIPGPRLFLAVGSLAGGRIAALGGRSAGDMTLSSRMVIETAAQARDVTRRFAEAGADMIKVHRGPPVEVYRAAAEAAHGLGLPVVAQPIGPTVYAREAVLAGANILEHAAGISISVARDPSKWEGWGYIEEHSLNPTPFSDMDDAKAAEMIELLIQRNVYLEPDLVCEGRSFHEQRDEWEAQDYRLLNDPGLAYFPERTRLKWMGNYTEFDDLEPAQWEMRKKGFQNMQRFIGMFAQAGGKVLAGTDTSGAGWAVAGIGLHHEFELLIEAGLTPMQVIQAATRNVAEAFRQLDQLGTIEAGKLADVVIVNADPLQDIGNLQQIEWVIQDGKVIDRGYHPSFQTPFQGALLEGRTWVRALKKESESMRTTAFGQPPPGIESISPTLVTEGDPTLTLTVKGVGFTSKSRVFFDGAPVPFERVSETELKLTIDASLIIRAGTYSVQVRNPEPLLLPKWGGVSNRAHLLVDYRY
ncbi:MAG: amidohydrolase family protein [Acidobacteria bacterium]|nr:amidohydrolase family protein [Acidobacteriota bacterium]